MYITELSIFHKFFNLYLIVILAQYNRACLIEPYSSMAKFIVNGSNLNTFLSLKLFDERINKWLYNSDTIDGLV